MLLNEALKLLENSGYMIQKNKYNFVPKEDSDLSFKEAAKIINKKYQNAFKYLKEH